LSDVLLSTLELSWPEFEKILALGAIYLNQQRISENIEIKEQDYLRVHLKPRRFVPDDHQWSSRVVFQNEHFVVVRKISGLPVHASVDNIQENLHAYLSAHLNCKLYVTHRLDVPTRGLIVYAKTLEFQSAFNKLLIERGVHKVYRAQVEMPATAAAAGPVVGILIHYMEPSPRAPKVVAKTPARNDWQECVLEILEIDGSHLKILLHTGRTHQIRAQLGFEGFPTVGDHAYGAKKIFNEDRIELEACELRFQNPLTGEQHEFVI
jgi:23S rRNA pseudouridine1911/1915/1917 synthase